MKGEDSEASDRNEIKPSGVRLLPEDFIPDADQRLLAYKNGSQTLADEQSDRRPGHRGGATGTRPCPMP